jgi:hypothetical protein
VPLKYNIILHPSLVGLLEVLKEENAPYELRFLTASKAENKSHLDTLFESIKKSKNGVCVCRILLLP